MTDQLCLWGAVQILLNAWMTTLHGTRKMGDTSVTKFMPMGPVTATTRFYERFDMCKQIISSQCNKYKLAMTRLDAREIQDY